MYNNPQRIMIEWDHVYALGIDPNEIKTQLT